MSNLLIHTHPELIKQIHPMKNKKITISKLTFGSKKILWWKCEKDHEWESTVQNRARGNGCPYCSGRKPTENNALTKTHPEIAKEWHPTKNGKLTPSDVSFGSEKSVWWKCEEGPDHEWEMVILSRKNGAKCPYCLNKKLSVTNSLKSCFPEISKDWNYEKNKNVTPDDVIYTSVNRVNWKCKDCKHEWETNLNDRTKNNRGCPKCARIKKHNPNALINTFPNLLKEWDYEKNKHLMPDNYLSTSKKKVWWKCEECEYNWEAPIKGRTEQKNKCPKCNSIFTLYPQLAKEWDYEKNKKLSIFKISPGSGKKVWWKCLDGHESYEAVTYSRVNSSSGCPKCGREKSMKTREKNMTKSIKKSVEKRRKNNIDKGNTMGNSKPELAKEWDYKKNGEMTPDSVTPNSKEKVWWKCSVCQNEWDATIASRNKGRGCPNCAKEIQIKKFKQTNLEKNGSLEEKHPLIAKEWDYEKNKGIKPSEISSGTYDEFWWKCELGHSYKTSPKFRCSLGVGCRYCKYEKRTSFPEQCIAFYLKKVFDDVENPYYIFSNNKKVEIDIFLPSLNIGIEYDGVYYHKKRVKKDNEKNKLLNKKNIEVFRIREEGLPTLEPFKGKTLFVQPKNKNKSLDIVIKNIFQFFLNNFPLSLKEKEKIKNLKIDIENDQMEINSLFVISFKKNSLGAKFPELSKEWHPTKNKSLAPTSVKVGSDKVVWWQCPSCKNEWKAQIYARTAGCHKCKKCKESNLINKHPELLEEWDHEENKHINVEEITYGSGQIAGWICKKGHRWKTPICYRPKNGCPYCAGQKVCLDNCFATKNPEAAKFWDDEKNGEVSPYDVMPYTKKVFWWNCRKCNNTWEESVANRNRTTSCCHCSNTVKKNKKEFKKVSETYNLFTEKPNLAEEWHPTKNGNSTPLNVAPQSNKKVWWKANCGHEWEAIITNRYKGNGCPFCSKTFVEKKNTLATLHPEILTIWNKEKNEHLNPNKLSPGSHKHAWWVCKEGHSWKEEIRRQITKKQNCPICKSK